MAKYFSQKMIKNKLFPLKQKLDARKLWYLCSDLCDMRWTARWPN